MYTALKETEQRATDVLPLWKLPALNVFSARQRKAAAAVALIRETTERLIAKCKDMVDDEEQARVFPSVKSEPAGVPALLSQGHAARTQTQEAMLEQHLHSVPTRGHKRDRRLRGWLACVCAQAAFEEGYINTADPSVLRFLIASRNEARSNSRSCTALVWRNQGGQPGSCPGLLPDLVHTGLPYGRAQSMCAMHIVH